MNKAELIEAVAAKIKVPKREVEAVLESIIDTIIAALKSDGEVTLTGFGAFSARKRSARMGVDPRKPHKKIKIPEVRVAKFKAGKVLKVLKEALKQ